MTKAHPAAGFPWLLSRQQLPVPAPRRKRLVSVSARDAAARQLCPALASRSTGGLGSSKTELLFQTAYLKPRRWREPRGQRGSYQRAEARREFLGQQAASERDRGAKTSSPRVLAAACSSLSSSPNVPACAGEEAVQGLVCSPRLAAEQQVCLSNAAGSTDSSAVPAPLQHGRK